MVDRTEFSNLIAEINHIIDSNNIKIDSLIYSEGQTTFKHFFSFKATELHEIRSISKLITSFCIGILIDSKKYSIKNSALNLESKIWPLFKNKVSIINETNIKYLEKITIKNLLTHSIGFKNEKLLLSSTIKTIDRENLLEFVFNEPISFSPGIHFQYSNASSYILSALIQELSGVNLVDFAQENLFKQLKIENFTWGNYGKYCIGGTGLFLQPEDVHKLGILLSRNGKWYNQQLVSVEFVNKMTKAHISTNNKRWSMNVLQPNAYGLFLWINKNGFYISGANGQYIIVNTTKNRIVSILANQEDPQVLLKCITQFLYK
ncbi:MAG: serine hydrolase [Carboxylicivirga sp.]|jgi:CubicO group peptidase (beta-lactamase class C family)|nr:serine hydrolase [Carboxylicivirga sp.]MCT4645813.1 serine hydrolase [Carboxylicivirga sp.]